MITAHISAYQNRLHVVFVAPDCNEEIDLPGSDHQVLAEQAKRILYFKNRSYIIEKLRGWLKQRVYALNQTDRANMTQDAAKLIVMLGYFEKRSFFRLCDMISGSRPAIETIAPGAHSQFRAAYERQIMPILEFCDQMKGGAL